MLKYKDVSLSIEEYRLNVLSDYDEITIDGGVILREDMLLQTSTTDDCYKVFNPKTNNYRRFSISKDYLFYKKNSQIDFIPGGQGMRAFANKYKIIWKTRFNGVFQFSDELDLLLKGNQSLVVSSNKKEVILFLFAILNSTVSLLVLREMMKMPNEAIFLVPITAIKQYIRVPKITPENAPVKQEIIKQTEALLENEKPVLQDFVDFPYTAMQTFDYIRAEGNALVLTAGDHNYTAKVHANKTKIVRDVIAAEYFPKGGLVPCKEINLETLRFLPAIDFEAQGRIKSYIDDLVFALYFNVSVDAAGIENAAAVHAECEKSEFYSLVNGGVKT